MQPKKGNVLLRHPQKNTKMDVRLAINFNNSGALCLKLDRPREAWDLFKGALEVTLVSEQIQDSPLERTEQSKGYVEKAQHHLARVDEYIQAGPVNGREKIVRSGRNTIARAIESMGLGEVLYQPHIFDDPFQIQAGEVQVAKCSAVIIFNLALVDHLLNRSSIQAISLYELATTLLVNDRIEALGVALMNNIGVWCYENGNVTASERCMEHISKVLSTDSSILRLDTVCRIKTNIRRILHPSLLTSPAA